MKSALHSTATWAMICRLFVAISPAFPWIHGDYEISVWYSAYSSGQGAAISVAGGVGLLFLLATGGVSPAPWWSIRGVAIVGVSAIVFLLIYAASHWNHFPLREYGGLMAVVATTGLMFITAWELRQLINARHSQSASHKSTADQG